MKIYGSSNRDVGHAQEAPRLQSFACVKDRLILTGRARAERNPECAPVGGANLNFEVVESVRATNLKFKVEVTGDDPINRRRPG